MSPRTPRITRAVVDQVLKVFRLESIKSRIVCLALLSTLIPSMGMAWISYAQNRAALTDKINGELQSVSAQTARELELWFKERLYEARVFATSDEVYENIERARLADGDGQPGARLRNYLTSVGDRSPHFTELIVVDREGQRLPHSVGGGGPGGVRGSTRGPEGSGPRPGFSMPYFFIRSRRVLGEILRRTAAP